jgi:hypothetical protein
MDGKAAAPHPSLAVVFWGEGLFVFPLMLLSAGGQPQRLQRQDRFGARALTNRGNMRSSCRQAGELTTTVSNIG